VKLKSLIKGMSIQQVKGSKDTEITGVCSHSQCVSPGNLFVARRGKLFDGAKYIPEAISAGAVAVLTDMYDPSLKGIVQLIDPQVSALEAQLAAVYYQHPCDKLFTIGVTGTNGKTTLAALVKYLFDACQVKCGLLGTIENIVGDYHYQATHTTSDVSTNYKMLREMLHYGSEAAVLEVTSHGLIQGRVEGIEFDVAVFTNLSQDHLDYHETMEAYAEAKSLLFSGLSGKGRRKKEQPLAIVNCDDSYCNRILKGCEAKVLTYGFSEGADIRAVNVELNAKHSRFLLRFQDEEYAVESPLIGCFNVYNVLAALAVVMSKGLALQDAVAAVSTMPFVRGRMESVSNSAGVNVYVDFAHNSRALENVLKTCQEVTDGKVILVFGAGGDRDQEKRPLMGEIAEKYSDLVIVTSDNPRLEDPSEISRQILSGMKSPEKALVELDRRKAIEKSLEIAKASDTVIIAGKGHERQQICGRRVIEFDDRQVVSELSLSR
jgi:UDP-N-acetylmuramoyl-L-alanyl-D-glutamate--2,6-diaminopimelate ligase